MNDNDKQNLLYDSCMAGDMETVAMCIINGVDIRANHDRALWLAREYGHTDIYNTLIKNGCTPLN